VVRGGDHDYVRGRVSYAVWAQIVRSVGFHEGRRVAALLFEFGNARKGCRKLLF
jgi:hypothetical protein